MPLAAYRLTAEKERDRIRVTVPRHRIRQWRDAGHPSPEQGAAIPLANVGPDGQSR